MIRTSWLLLFLSALLGIVPLGCCKEPGAREDALEPEALAAQVPAEPELEEWPGTERWTGDFDGMLERRLIRVAVPYNKIFFFFVGGRPRGVAVEALAEFEKFLNRKLGLSGRTGKRAIRVVLVPRSHQDIPRAIVEGRVDLAVANLSITPERLQTMDFSIPVYENVTQIIVTGPASPKLRTLDGLSGQEIWVKASSTHYSNLQILSDDLVKRGKRPIRIRDADENLEDDDILEMVAAGNYSTTATDRYIAEFWARVLPGLKPRQDLVLSTGGEKGWAFRKNSPKLAALVNEFLKDRRIGTLYGNILANRYLKNTELVRNASSHEARARFRKLSALFQKYAGMYGLPWELVAAQSYQESRFNNAMRNPSGAVGIMQVLPSTAAAPPISIRNISRLENNIHAGVKILKFIRDDYFNDEGMDEVNKTLMAVAAYNAGPARISSCRKRAVDMGLDPKVWFGNVEYAVAEVVGRETVLHVNNVYKYYLTFRLAAERSGQRSEAIKAVKK
jgi:membrane-bound lytic murein transglycosylase MltF